MPTGGSRWLRTSSASPSQRHRPAHRMLKLAAVLLYLEHGVLQTEIPFCRTVGVVDQHEVRIVFQALGLQFHGAAILLYEFSEDEFQQLGAEGNPAEQIPCGHYVDAAPVARDGSDGGEA